MLQMDNSVPHRLRSILAYKRDEVATLLRDTPLSSWEARVSNAPPVRPFSEVIVRAAQEDGNALICEVKRKSPSAGDIDLTSSPEATAVEYASGGASCISVLTDYPSFGGTLQDMEAVRLAVDVPVLRKDFMVDPVQVYEARAAGADAILIIMAAVDDTLAAELEDVATRLGMAVLVESHTSSELERALRLSSPLMGVNNRDLHTFTTDLGVTERLAAEVPKERVLISESGIRTSSDIRRLRACGARGFLIGESVMRSAAPSALVQEMASQR